MVTLHLLLKPFISIQVSPPHRLGLGAGPYLLGFLVPQTGYRGLFLMMVFVILISIGLYYFLHGRTEKKQKSEEANIGALQEI
jgi:hypothetical protein